MSRAQSRMATPLVNAEAAESVMKTTIYRNWKQIQQMCRQKDNENTGTISVVDLKGSSRENLKLYGNQYILKDVLAVFFAPSYHAGVL